MTKKYNYTKKPGRPTKYKEQYCEAILEYFSIDHTEEVEISHINTKGDEWKSTELRANAWPTFEGFCAKIGISDQTLLDWTIKHKDFLGSYMRAKQLQKDMLLDNSLTKRYDSNFAKFVAINCCSMKETLIQELTGKDGLPLVPEIIVFAQREGKKE